MQPMAAALTLGLCCALAQLPALGLALRNQIVAALGAPLVSGRSWGSPHPMAQPGGWLASPPNCGGRNRGARSLGRAVGPLDAWGSSPGPAVGEDGGATSVVRSLARGRPKSGPNGKLHCDCDARTNRMRDARSRVHRNHIMTRQVSTNVLVSVTVPPSPMIDLMVL